VSLNSPRAADVTREKLRCLEETADAVRRDTGDNPRVRELTLRSLKALINQLREELTLYEARSSARAPTP
jgi:hypothetical protein